MTKLILWISASILVLLLLLVNSYLQEQDNELFVTENVKGAEKISIHTGEDPGGIITFNDSTTYVSLEFISQEEGIRTYKAKSLENVEYTVIIEKNAVTVRIGGEE